MQPVYSTAPADCENLQALMKTSNWIKKIICYDYFSYKKKKHLDKIFLYLNKSQMSKRVGTINESPNTNLSSVFLPLCRYNQSDSTHFFTHTHTHTHIYIYIYMYIYIHYSLRKNIYWSVISVTLSSLPGKFKCSFLNGFLVLKELPPTLV